MLRLVPACLAFCLCLVLMPASSSAQAFKGSWNTEDMDARVNVSACGEGICAQIIGLKDPLDKETGKPQTDVNNPDASKRGRPVVGLGLFSDMKPAGENIWKGKIYNPEDGKSYAATVTFKGDSLLVKGCALGGLICQENAWTR